MQGSKLYVGNLDYGVTNESLRDLFSKCGTVVEANVIQGKGFGFVQMSTPEEAQQAKDSLDGTELNQRTLKVDEARPRESRPDRGYDSSRSRGGYGRF